jgi:phage terminase large subunit-like protein
VVGDELHAWLGGGGEMYSVLETGCAARAQPIMLSITTAGHDQQTKCYELHKYAKDVRDGRTHDPTFLPIIFGLDEHEDWKDEANWYKANPNLGVSLPVEYLKQQCLKAQNERSFENAFRRLHLDQWTSVATRWLSMDAWDACEDRTDRELDKVAV